MGKKEALWMEKHRRGEPRGIRRFTRSVCGLLAAAVIATGFTTAFSTQVQADNDSAQHSSRQSDYKL